MENKSQEKKDKAKEKDEEERVFLTVSVTLFRWPISSVSNLKFAKNLNTIYRKNLQQTEEFWFERLVRELKPKFMKC